MSVGVVKDLLYQKQREVSFFRFSIRLGEQGLFLYSKWLWLKILWALKEYKETKTLHWLHWGWKVARSWKNMIFLPPEHLHNVLWPLAVRQRPVTESGSKIQLKVTMLAHHPVSSGDPARTYIENGKVSISLGHSECICYSNQYSLTNIKTKAWASITMSLYFTSQRQELNIPYYLNKSTLTLLWNNFKNYYQLYLNALLHKSFLNT